MRGRYPNGLPDRTHGLSNLSNANAVLRASRVDYGPSIGAPGAPPRRRAGRLPGLAARRARPVPVAGAVRLSVEPARRVRHVGKASAVLLFAAGGILVTTASTGTVERAPRVVTDADRIVPPAFFFDDAEDALAAFAAPVPSVLPVPASAPTPAGGPTDALVEALSKASVPGAPAPATAGAAEPAALAALRARLEPPADAVVETVTVAAGDTLSGILNRHGVRIEQMPELLADEAVKRHLGTLRIGQGFEITRRADGTFFGFAAKLGEERRLTIRPSDSGFAVAAIDLPVEKERVVSSGTIDSSLYEAAKAAELKRSTIMELADVFQWELDFSRDIRAGDTFAVVYDRLYRDGRYIGDGDILAAEFVRGGKTHRAVRFTTPDGETGYYAPDGSSKKRAFLRHPVDVARVTSKFNPERLHPVLGTRRPHRGVDYGAPHGSPIFAAADGTVEFAGTKGGYGKTVVLRHGKSIETLYAHMSRIGDRSTKGAKVRQGDVIGYVGRTGRVTGTHLHYEFRKNGVHVDPLIVKLPGAGPIAPRHRADLATVSERMVAQMRAVVPDDAVPGAVPSALAEKGETGGTGGTGDTVVAAAGDAR